MNTTPHRIDAHHHLWRYTPEEYGWINEQMGILRRDFLPGDLKPLLDRAGIQERSQCRRARILRRHAGS